MLLSPPATNEPFPTSSPCVDLSPFPLPHVCNYPSTAGSTITCCYCYTARASFTDDVVVCIMADSFSQQADRLERGAPPVKSSTTSSPSSSKSSEDTSPPSRQRPLAHPAVHGSCTTMRTSSNSEHHQCMVSRGLSYLEFLSAFCYQQRCQSPGKMLWNGLIHYFNKVCQVR